MKRTKKIVALLAVTALTFGPFSTVFAAEADEVKEDSTKYEVVYKGNINVNDTKDGTPAEKLEKVYGSGSSVNKSKDGTDAENLEKVYGGGSSVNQSKDGTDAEKLETIYGKGTTVGQSTQPKAAETGEKVYGALEYTEKHFYAAGGKDRGVYPSFKDADALNAKLEMDLLKLSNGEILADNYVAYPVTSGESSVVVHNKGQFNVSYDEPVEELGRYAYVNVYVNYQETPAKIQAETITLTYYIDKDTMTQSTKEVYDKAVEDAKVAEEEAAKEAEEAALEEEKEEVVLVPVRAIAEKLGYTLSWEGATKSVIVSKGDVSVSFTNDVNSYKVGDKTVELEIAPTLVDSVMHVPNTFFSKLLEVKLIIEADGGIYVDEKLIIAGTVVEEEKSDDAKEVETKEPAEDSAKVEDKEEVKDTEVTDDVKIENADETKTAE